MQGETRNKKKVSFDLSVGLETRKKRKVSFDLSMGVEKCPVDLQCREGTRQGPPHFKYVKCSVRHGSANLILPGFFESGESCRWKCGWGCGTKRRRCPCAASQGGLPPYQADGLLHPHYIETVLPKASKCCACLLHLSGFLNYFLWFSRQQEKRLEKWRTSTNTAMTQIVWHWRKECAAAIYLALF